MSLQFLRAGLVAATAMTVMAMAQPAMASVIVPGFDTSSFPANDDGATGAIALGFTVNYFGVDYVQAFVSNNGYLTFNSGQGTYTPSGLGAGYTGQPIIAPFFADVDTRGTGSGLTTYGTGTFDGHDAFGATWVDVGYYSGQTNKLNSFQVLLVDRSDVSSGDFDIYFNYDKIQWETGGASGGSNGLGGTSAAAGYNAGTGAPDTFGQLAGSLVNGALLDGGPNSLVANSNIGVDGRYLFTVRNGSVTVPTTPGAVPEPATWAMMIAGFGLAGAALRRRNLAVTFA